MGINLPETTVRKHKNLGELLCEEGLITREQLDLSLEQQSREGGDLKDILINRNLVSPKDLAAVLSVHFNLPFIDLQRHKIQPRALQLVSETIARRHTLIPLDILSDALVVVMADPENVHTIQDLQAQVKMKIEPAIGVAADIKRAIDINYRSAAEIAKKVKDFSPAVKETTLSEEMVARTPIAETVDLIINQAIRDRASDIHIEPQETRLRIRFRIDGTLYDMFSLPLSVHIPLVSRIKILAEMNIAEQRRPQDGQISFTAAEKPVDIRVASIATAFGERLALRILDKSLALFKLEELGLLTESLHKFEKIMQSPYGLFLVGGPTGSGKTTTLYSLLNSLNRSERNIMTIEDPIEYRFEDINQTQVNIKAGITFPAGLRALMRHDPNIILVGEIRDRETASIAVQAALTGHLVLSSIHANNSVGVLFRLLDLGIEPYLVVSTLIGISTQRMARRICPHCRITYTPAEQEKELFRAETISIPPVLYNRGSGCNLCAKTGFEGRIGLFEVLLMSDVIRKLLVNNSNAVEIENQAVTEGLITMKSDGLQKVIKGIIPTSEVLRSVFALR
ncbi:MAG TPA: ATPase, T2SS/T4P/T4SS family [Dehalococcoidales bacterium]|nr:ATPase, T2SS/T4P/T4SS family [Dehalococcoidales bacterium]